MKVDHEKWIEFVRDLRKQYGEGVTDHPTEGTTICVNQTLCNGRLVAQSYYIQTPPGEPCDANYLIYPERVS